MITKTARGFARTVLDMADIGIPLKSLSKKVKPAVRPENLGMPLGRTNVPAHRMGIPLDKLKKKPVPPQNMGMPISQATPSIATHPERLGIHVDDLKPMQPSGNAMSFDRRLKDLRLMGAM